MAQEKNKITALPLVTNLEFCKIIAPTVVEWERKYVLFFGGVLKGGQNSRVYCADLISNGNYEKIEAVNIVELEISEVFRSEHDGICPSWVFSLGGKLVMYTASFVVDKLNKSEGKTNPYSIKTDVFSVDYRNKALEHKHTINFFKDSPHLFECGATFDSESSLLYFVHGQRFIFDSSNQKLVPEYRLSALSLKDGIHSSDVRNVIDERFYFQYHGVSRVTFFNDHCYFAARKINQSSFAKSRIYRTARFGQGEKLPEYVVDLHGLNFPHIFRFESKFYCVGAVGHMGDGCLAYVGVNENI